MHLSFDEKIVIYQKNTPQHTQVFIKIIINKI